MARTSRQPPEAEVRDGVALSNLGTPLFSGSEATKRDLVDYLDALADRLVPVLAGRALSVVRVRPGQEPFMQKNTPKYAPDWLPTLPVWSQASHREVHYPICDDRRTLLWFANQRAVEFHPTLFRGAQWGAPTYLVLDLDPPAGDPDDGRTAFGLAVRAALLVREVLEAARMASLVKTSGAKGVHVLVPLAEGAGAEDVAAATRAVAARAERLDPRLATTAFVRDERGGRVFLDSTRAGGATVAAAYSPRIRPGTPVSMPVAWADLDAVSPRDVTVRTAVGLLAGADPWTDLMPAPQQLDDGLVEEGRTIPVARVQAMHEGKRRARARRDEAPPDA